MLGILLQRIGAAGICLTDGDAQTLCNCLHNLRINEAQVHRIPCNTSQGGQDDTLEHTICL